MRMLLMVIAVVSLNTACAMSQDASAPPPPAAPSAPVSKDGVLTEQSNIDEILDALDARGKNLKDFEAALTLEEQNLDTGLGTTRTGSVKFARGAEQDARMLVTFDNRKVNEQEAKPEKTVFLLDPPWLIERNYRGKVEVRRKVLKEGEKLNLLKLGEGPFPLPIGQSKEDVHKLFEVKKVLTEQDDPAGTVHVQLIPRGGTPFGRRYSTIDVWVEPTLHMPVRIKVIDKSETSEQTTDLKNIRLNTGLAQSDFTLPSLPPGWERHEEAYQE